MSSYNTAGMPAYAGQAHVQRDKLCDHEKAKHTRVHWAELTEGKESTK
jgi:hypothetical protein